MENTNVEQDPENAVGASTGPHFSTGFKQSDRLREAVSINLGLLALKKCVEALNSDSKTKHVPYADSKLTMLLSSGLGGDSKTTVVVCASKDQEHCSETIAALRFGESCRKVEQNARSGATMLAGLIEQIDTKIKACEARILENERWEVVEEQRGDSRAEEGTMESQGFGGVEIKKITILVGAEKDRMELTELLKERADLTGTTLESEIGGSKYGGGVGFGNKGYGFGEQFEVAADDSATNYRFKENVDTEELPEVLKTRGKVAGWKAGSATDESGRLSEAEAKRIEKKAKTVNRQKMSYAGISA